MPVEPRKRQHAIRGADEDGEPAIAFASGTDHLSVVLGHDLFDQGVVAREAAPIVCALRSQALVLPSTSVNRNVIVPLGSAGVSRAGSPITQRVRDSAGCERDV
jgi:hypothetical protein